MLYYYYQHCQQTVRCFRDSEPAAVTIDAAGVVNKLTFRRVMWTAWVADTECLLDGAAGRIPAVSVLPGWTGVSIPPTVPSEQPPGGAPLGAAAAGRRLSGKLIV
jgi:hypothetical protein